MMTLAIRQKQTVSLALILTMLFSCLLVPTTVNAGVLGTVGNAAKWLVQKAGTFGAAYGGAVLAMSIGGGPIGMVLGGVAGYIVGGKVMNWATSSTSNFAMLAGGAAGVLLTMGMGIPVMAAAGVIGAVGAWTIAKLIKKISGKTAQVAVGAVDSAKIAVQDTKAQAFIDSMLGKQSTTTSTTCQAAAAPQEPTAPKAVSQDAYNRYLAAYRTYMDATQKGDSATAQSAYKEYQAALKEYRGGK